MNFIEKKGFRISELSQLIRSKTEINKGVTSKLISFEQIDFEKYDFYFKNGL